MGHRALPGFLNNGRAAWPYVAVIVQRGRRGEGKVGAMGHHALPGFSDALHFVGPFVGLCHKAGTDWILKDILTLLFSGFDRSEPVIKEVALPFDVLRTTEPTLDAGDDRFHADGSRKLEEAVKVIRHGEEEFATEETIGLAMFDGVADGLPCHPVGELVDSAWLAIDGDEIGFFLG
jgi:hypothetical protein